MITINTVVCAAALFGMFSIILGKRKLSNDTAKLLLAVISVLLAVVIEYFQYKR
jgi:FtsH-binding integral membrane protein